MAPRSASSVQTALPIAGPGSTLTANSSSSAGSNRRPSSSARTVLAELEGRRFEPALVLEFAVSVEPGPAMGRAVWTLLALLGAITAVGLYVASVRARTSPAPAAALDLLEIPPVRRILTSRTFQLSLQFPVL